MSSLEQRSGRTSRRRFLGTLGTAAGGVLAGCSTPNVVGRRLGTGNGQGSSRTPVSMLAAGSLQRALSEGLQDVVNVPLQTEAHGSVTVARLVAAGKRDPDVVSVADPTLLESMVGSPWYAIFASNAIVVAYNPETDGGRRVRDAGRERWYEPVLDGTARIGRTDPDQDPLGYRTLFALELAARYYDEPDLQERFTTRDQVYPETALLSRFETGAVDAVVAYENMAVERGYEYVDLPDEIDMSNPRHVDGWYSTVSYTLPEGQTVTGDLVRYGATARRLADPVVDVFRAHVTDAYLEQHGFTIPGGFPEYEGDVPDRIGS